MKFIRAIVPNLCISLWLALLTLAILDVFNPLMGFLRGTAFLVLLGLCAASSLCCAIGLYAVYRRDVRRRRRRARRERALDEDGEP
ncbi:MAG: hypothetical protein IK095_07825 [Oscillospiraceae bacterium]|nr:hypothetical protein [Oscillospiraceae bacterium]